MKNVTEAARVILTTKLEWDRHPLTIPGRWGSCCAILGQLDRKTYVEVNAVLEAAGGVWNRKHRKHLFTVEVAEARAKVDGMLGTGKIVNEDKEAEFFPTPAPLAEAMAVTAGIEPGMLVLEPSAGDGALVAAAVAMGGRVDARVDGTSENDCACFHTARNAVPSFEFLWSAIYGAESWRQNAWVWAVTFRRLQ